MLELWTGDNCAEIIAPEGEPWEYSIALSPDIAFVLTAPSSTLNFIAEC